MQVRTCTWCVRVRVLTRMHPVPGPGPGCGYREEVYPQLRISVIMQFGGLDGPGGTRNHSTRRGASCPALWSGFGDGQKSSILLGLGGPGGAKTRSRRWGGYDPHLLDWSWGPPKFKKINDFQPAHKPCIKNPSVNLYPCPGSSSAHGIPGSRVCPCMGGPGCSPAPGPSGS